MKKMGGKFCIAEHCNPECLIRIQKKVTPNRALFGNDCYGREERALKQPGKETA